MGQVAVTINGHIYQIACDDGQEDHLRELALYVDARVGELVSTVGQVGDTRLLVMTSLLLADEVSETKGDLARVREKEYDMDKQAEIHEALLASGIEELAARIETIADRLEKSADAG